MRTFGKIIVVIALLIGGAILWWQITYPTYTYRYRITIDVEVDGAIKTGSSVIEVTCRWDPVPGRPISHYSISAKGEAAFVDLGKGRNVIVLLASEGGKNGDFPKYIVSEHFKMACGVEDLPKYRGLKGRWILDPATLRWNQLLTMITFRDLSDPLSAETVHGYEFPKVFGADVQAPTISIEMTSDPVTSGIEQKLPWWHGPFPWLKPSGSGVFIDTRTDGFIWRKDMFKREY